MNEPKIIYLNIGFDKDESDLKDEDFEKLIGVSWSDSRINDQDLRYELKPVCTNNSAEKEYKQYKDSKKCNCKLPSYKTTKLKVYGNDWLCDECCMFLTKPTNSSND